MSFVWSMMRNHAPRWIVMYNLTIVSETYTQFLRFSQKRQCLRGGHSVHFLPFILDLENKYLITFSISVTTGSSNTRYRDIQAQLCVSVCGRDRLRWDHSKPMARAHPPAGGQCNRPLQHWTHEGVYIGGHRIHLPGHSEYSPRLTQHRSAGCILTELTSVPLPVVSFTVWILWCHTVKRGLLHPRDLR